MLGAIFRDIVGSFYEWNNVKTKDFLLERPGTRYTDDSVMKSERQVMDKLLAYLKMKNHPLRHWFYGHFHQSWYQEIDGVQYNMLDIMELRELR